MPQIIIQNLLSKAIKVEDTTNSVLQSIQKDNIDWMHSCGGKGRCTTCKLIVEAGKDNLSELSPFEKKCRDAGLLKDDERLACQCRALSDVVIRVPHKYKLPHMEYSD